MDKILDQNTMRFISRPKQGQLVIVRNLDYMKKWSEDEISEIFDDEGQLRHVLSDKLHSRERIKKGRVISRRRALPMTEIPLEIHNRPFSGPPKYKIQFSDKKFPTVVLGFY